MNKYLTEINEELIEEFFGMIYADMGAFIRFIAENFKVNFYKDSDQNIFFKREFFGINGKILPETFNSEKMKNENEFQKEYEKIKEECFSKCSKKEIKVLENYEAEMSYFLIERFKMFLIKDLKKYSSNDFEYRINRANQLRWYTEKKRKYIGLEYIFMNKPSWKILRNYLIEKELLILEKVKEEYNIKETSANFSLFISKRLQLIQKCFNQLTPINCNFKNNKEYFEKHITIFGSSTKLSSLYLLSRLVAWKSFLSKINAEKVKDVKYTFIINNQIFKMYLNEFDYLITRNNKDIELKYSIINSRFLNDGNGDKLKIINCKTKCYEFLPLNSNFKNLKINKNMKMTEITELWGIKL